MSKFTKAFCLLVSLVSSSKVQYRALGLNKHLQSNKSLRVIGGEDIQLGEYVFVVLGVDLGGYRMFTASMITPEWVLTCAHCVVDEYGEFDTGHIMYGDFTKPRGQTNLYTDILNIFVHPNYENFDNDISLVRVREVHLQDYGRLSAVDHFTMIGLPVKYVGGGWTNYSKDQEDDQFRPLQVGEGVIAPCGDRRTSTIHVICVVPKCSKTLHLAYYGDSGGPLLHDGKIIGVLSYGDNRGTGDAYAPVGHYLDWISHIFSSQK